MTDGLMPALRPDLYGQLAATDAYQGRARRLFERGQVVAVEGNQADVRVGYDARGNALELKQVPIMSGYVPSVGDWVSIQYEAGHSSAPWVTGPSMAADETSDAAGIGVFPVRDSEPPDPQRSAIYFDESLETWRGWDGADWVDFSGKLHNSLPDLQGGTAGEYYHLTEDEYGAIGGGAFPATAVIYADANGKLAGDATKLKWTGGQLQLVAGSAAAPSVSRIGYTDDGIFFPADAMLGFATTGIERARIGDAGLLLLGGAGGPGYHLIFAGDRPAHIWLDQALVGTGYAGDLYHSLYAGGRTFRWGRSQGYYDRPNFVEYMRLSLGGGDTDTQLLGPMGSAATPGLGFIADPDCGWYYAATYIGAVLDGTERFRWSGNDVGMVAGGKHYWDGVACSGDTWTAEQSANYLLDTVGGTATFGRIAGHVGIPATGRFYGDGAACSGDTYLRERVANVWCFTAGGNDQFEVRSTHQYGRPTTYDPANDGEFNFETDDNALKHRVGSVVHRNGLCIYSGSVVSDGTWSTSERTLDSFTVPAAYWKVGKRVSLRATVEAQASTGATGNVTIRVYIGSTLAMEKSMAAASSLGRGGHYDFEMDFVVGALAGSGTTIYPSRTIRSYTSTDGASFGNIQSVAAHEMYPMRPAFPGLAINTTAGQAISVVYVCGGSGTCALLLQGLTIYST